MSVSQISLSNKVCSKPFEYLDIDISANGDINCHACCPSILPVITGDLKKNTINEIWNGKIYNNIRESILDGSYKYCKADLCPEIQTDNLLDIRSHPFHYLTRLKQLGLKLFNSKPKIINLSYDRTCNLACPSCRKDFFTTNSIEDDLVIEKITNDILSRDLSNTTLIACSSGDPFVGVHFRNLLCTLDGKQHLDLKIQIMTNGLLFNRKAWELMHKIHSNISMVCVSIDASTPATYGITRKGGNWNLLMKNLELLSMLRGRGEIGFLRIDFVVQDHNYLEMVDFVALGEKLKVDEVFFQKVTNWGHYTKDEFQQRAIYKEDHIDYQNFLKMISHPDLCKKFVNHGNLGHFFNRPAKEVVPIPLRRSSFVLKNAIKHSFENYYFKYLIFSKKLISKFK